MFFMFLCSVFGFCLRSSKMSLYPSLETMAMAQRESASVPSAPYPTPRTSSYPLAPTAPITYGYGGVSAQPAPNNESTTCYPQLQYMDLEITPEMMREMGIGNELIPAYSVGLYVYMICNLILILIILI